MFKIRWVGIIGVVLAVGALLVFVRRAQQEVEQGEARPSVKTQEVDLEKLPEEPDPEVAAALESADPEVRHDAVNRLLSDNTAEAEQFLPLVLETLNKIADDELETFSRWKGKDVQPLIRFISKHPARRCVPLLLRVAGRQDLTVMEGDNVVSTDGRVLPMKNPRSIFPDVALALKHCTNGEIGVIGQGKISYLEREKLVKEWKTWWDAK